MRRAILYLAVACLCIPITGVQAGCSSPRLKVVESRTQSGQAGQEPSFLVISDQARLKELHSSIYSIQRPVPPSPEVDFSKQRVLVVFMGEQRTAGYAVKIDEEIRLQNDTAEVTVRFERPPPDAIVAQVITTPYAMAVFDRGAYRRVRFVDEKGTILETIGVD
jgi:hypothetical protein